MNVAYAFLSSIGETVGSPTNPFGPGEKAAKNRRNPPIVTPKSEAF